MTRMVGSMIMSDQEADENDGDAKIIDILEGKLTALEHAIKKFQRTKAANLNTGTDPNGLPNLLPSDPTTGTVGGINLSNEVMFRPSSYNFAGGLDENNIEEAFDDILLDLTHDDESPNVIFVGRNIWRMHKAAARDKTQISLAATGFGKQLINLGIKGTTHQGIPLIYDEAMGANAFYFVNDEYLKIHILKNANMKVKKLTAPWNQDAIGRRYVMEYQLCSWKNYRTHAYGTN
jgi:rhodanese-related sulfurtransferase